MAKKNPSVILLRGDPINKEYPLYPLDVYGAGSILPGMLIELTTTKTVRPHSTATGVATAMFADVGLALDPHSATQGDIFAPYDTDGQTVRCLVCKPGDEIYALLEAGGGNDAAIGDLLESNGAGLLQKGATHPIARALEHIDNDPGLYGDPIRIRVEVL